MIKKFYVYVMASECNRVLYIGMTNDLYRRVKEHEAHLNKGFTFKNNVTKLVFYEKHYYINDTINREKQLKKWKRAWKNELIESINSQWLNIYPDFCLNNPREI
ncbi:MAG: GIY-YIG nuclease family protein [Bacteroidia bacterium]|nr:GIY-YIG nuclease family protein [Bacteroidia bacterium]